MKQFTIELGEMTCKWLEHISALTDTPVEKVIAIGVENVVIALEEDAFKAFTDPDRK